MTRKARRTPRASPPQLPAPEGGAAAPQLPAKASEAQLATVTPGHLRDSAMVRTAFYALLDAGLGKGDGIDGKAEVRREVERLAAEVAGPTPSPLEVLLAQRVALTWLELLNLDAYLGQLGHTLSGGRFAFVDKRRDRATARHLAAIRSLAQLRRLMRPGPAVQVNVGHGLAQVNLAHLSAEELQRIATGGEGDAASQSGVGRSEGADRSQRPAPSKSDRGEARPHEPNTPDR